MKRKNTPRSDPTKHHAVACDDAAKSPVVAVVETLRPDRKVFMPGKAIAVRLIVFALAFLFAVGLLVAGIIDQHFQLGFWASFWRGLLFAVCGLAAITLVATVYLGVLLVFSDYRDRWRLSRACRDAGESGPIRLVRIESARAWFSRGCTLETEFEQHFETARKRFASLVGRHVPLSRPLLILCFEKTDSFLHDFRQPWMLPGVYVPWPVRRILLCEEAGRERLVSPAALLRQLLAAYFLEMDKGFLPHPWLTWGMQRCLGADDEEDCRRARNRRIPLWLATGKTLGAEQLFDETGPALLRKMRNEQNLDAFDYVARFGDQSCSLVEYLLDAQDSGIRPERFRAFVDELRRRDDYQAVFERHFGFGWGQLLDDWSRWARAQNVATTEPIAPEVRQTMEERLIPLVRDSGRPADKRITAIRSIGLKGAVSGADALIDLLRGENPDLRKEALWALQVISGEPHTEDVGFWEDWSRRRRHDTP